MSSFCYVVKGLLSLETGRQLSFNPSIAKYGLLLETGSRDLVPFAGMSVFPRFPSFSLLGLSDESNCLRPAVAFALSWGCLGEKKWLAQETGAFLAVGVGIARFEAVDMSGARCLIDKKSSPAPPQRLCSFPKPEVLVEKQSLGS